MKRTLLVLLLTCSAAFGSSRYTQQMFRRAMAQNNATVTPSGRLLPMSKDPNVEAMRFSLSPLYVLITLRDPKTGADREVCTLATYLTGAINDEYRLDVL